MRYAEINRRFTELVTDYIAQGWNINTASMHGLQGEVAKIDLTNGTDIIRVMIEKISGSKTYYHDGYEITVRIARDARNNANGKPNSYDTWGTMWNENLDIIHAETYYFAGRNHTDWFVDEETVKANGKKSTDRLISRRLGMKPETDITDKAAKVVLPYVKRQKGCKTAKLSDIRVVKGTTLYDGKKYFLVICRGHRWTLK